MTEITNLDALEAEISGNRTLLRQHQQNLRKLQQDKAIFAAGEDPLRLDNQIAAETRHIEGVKAQLKDLFYRKLLQLVALATLSIEEVGVLYRKCRPANFVKQLPPPESSIQLVERLWQMRDIKDNETPILEFVERLARLRHATPVEAQLRSWQNAVIDLGLLATQPTAIADLHERINAVEDSQSDSALLVEIAPDPGAAAAYLVRIYYWAHGTNVCWHKQENDKSGHYNRTYTLHEIPNLIYRVLSEHEEKPASLEFLLPRELLVEAVDQWESDDDPIKFCSEYHIAIRSWERIAISGLSKWRQRWRERWQMFQAMRDERDVQWVMALGGDEATKFYQHMVNEKLKAVCLGLTFLSPTHTDEQTRAKILNYILMAGIPIMAWSRMPAGAQMTAQELQAELGTILCKEHLDILPTVIQRLRTCPEVLESAQHIGNRLALFWDDPDRVPDTYRW